MIWGLKPCERPGKGIVHVKPGRVTGKGLWNPGQQRFAGVERGALIQVSKIKGKGWDYGGSRGGGINRSQDLSFTLWSPPWGEGVCPSCTGCVSKEQRRITEWLGLEGILKIIWFHPPAMSRDIFHQNRVLTAPSNLALNPAREGAATASLGNLGQGLTTLMGKNFFLTSRLEMTRGLSLTN